MRPPRGPAQLTQGVSPRIKSGGLQDNEEFNPLMELNCDKVELKLRQGGSVEGGAWLGEVGHQQVCLWELSLVLTPPSLGRLSSGSWSSQCELLCYDGRRPLKLVFFFLRLFVSGT